MDFSGKLPRKKARSCRDKFSLMAVESESSSSTCEPVVQYTMSTGVSPDVMKVDSAIPPPSKPVLQLVTASQGIAPLGDQDDESDPSASSSDCNSRGGFSQASFDIDTPIESLISSKDSMSIDVDPPARQHIQWHLQSPGDLR